MTRTSPRGLNGVSSSQSGKWVSTNTFMPASYGFDMGGHHLAFFASRSVSKYSTTSTSSCVRINWCRSAGISDMGERVADSTSASLNVRTIASASLIDISLSDLLTKTPLALVPFLVSTTQVS